MWYAPRSSSSPIKAYPTTSSPPNSVRPARSSASGASGLRLPDYPGWKLNLGAGARPAFPPSLVVQVKALACELPHRLGIPLSRLSIEEIRQHVISQGLVAEISGATLWRWLCNDALRPWQHRSWTSLGTPNLLPKPAPSSTSMSALGRALHWARVTS